MNLKSLVVSTSLAATAISSTAMAQAADDRCGFSFTLKDNGPLTMAICTGPSTKVINLVLNGHLDVNAKDPQGYTPLDVAFHSSVVYWDPGYDLSTIGFLLHQGADPNAAFRSGELPLTAAAYFGRLDVVETLARSGANVNAVDTAGHTALRNAAHCDFRLSSDGRAASVIHYLVDHGADVTAKSSEGSLLDSVPKPCANEPDLCTADNLKTNKAWPTGYCKDTYLVVKRELEAASK